jgi:glucose/arabinose dehydrogenase
MKGSKGIREAVVAGGVAVGLLLGAGASMAQQADPLPRPIRGELPAAAEEVFVVDPPGIEVTPYATGLEVVWSLEFAPDGRLFVAERPGRVRVVSAGGQLDPAPWLTVQTEVRLEDGLLGLALHPDFANQPWVYVFYTFRKGEDLVNRVSRFREVNGRGTSEEVLLDDLPSFRIHNGGRLAFGPDGMLYITLGEVSQPLRSQDLDDLAGSVLRITPEGAIPADNPWSGSPIWAYGVRNPHGLAFRPSDGALFLSDNGPSSEWGPLRIGARDELNIIVKGGNYGWPAAVGAPGVDPYIDPILSWNPALPPGGLAFYDAELMPELAGNLFYTSLSGQALLRIQFDDAQAPDRPTRVERWFRPDLRSPSTYGRLRGVTVGPDGAIYVGTGNHDNRSPLREGDDRVLRIAPAGK